MSNRSVMIFATLVMALATLGSPGCASLKTAGHPWTTHYVGNPDAVWQALHISMIELDYDVESENRFEGTIRASRSGENPDTTVVLSIDQIMRTNDVNVYVRVAAGPGEPDMELARQEALAKEFLALVNGLLYK